jgi:hypothetical protein
LTPGIPEYLSSSSAINNIVLNPALRGLHRNTSGFGNNFRCSLFDVL